MVLQQWILKKSVQPKSRLSGHMVKVKWCHPLSHNRSNKETFLFDSHYSFPCSACPRRMRYQNCIPPYKEVHMSKNSPFVSAISPFQGMPHFIFSFLNKKKREKRDFMLSNCIGIRCFQSSSFLASNVA